MKHKKTNSLIIVLLIITCNSIYSQQNISINWHPDTDLHLGACIDHNAIFESKQDCLTLSEREWIDGGAVETEISTQFISNFRDVSDKFVLSYHSDIKSTLSIADGASGGGSISYDFTFDNFFQKISNSLYFVIKAETSHGRIKNKVAKLKPEFQKLIDDHKFDEFISKCGTHYVRFETRKSSVYAVISINNIETEIRNKIIYKYAATANAMLTGIGSADSSVKLYIDNLFKEISKYGKVEIKYLAHGSNGIQSFSPTIASSGEYEINNILSNLSKALNDFNKDNSAPAEYRLASFKPFGLLNLSLKKDKLIYLERTQANINSLFDTSNHLKEIKKTRYSDYKSYYERIDEEVLSLIESSVTKLKSCYFDNQFDVKNIPDDSKYLKEVIWPSNIFSDITLNFVPSYTKGKTEDGEIKSVLSSLSLVVNGIIRHSDFYKSMTPIHITSDLKLLPTNGWVYNENNPSIASPFKSESNIKAVPFHLRLESFNLNIRPENDGYVKIDEILKQKYKDLIKILNERDYIVQIETTDDFIFSQKVEFNFKENDIETIKKK